MRHFKIRVASWYIRWTWWRKASFVFEREIKHLIVPHYFSRESPLCPHQRNIRRLKHISIKPWVAFALPKSRGFRTKRCGRCFSCKCVTSSFPWKLFVFVVVIVYIGLNDLWMNPGRKPRWRAGTATFRCWRWSFFTALTINTWTPSATVTLTGDSVAVMEQLMAKVSFNIYSLYFRPC